MSEAVVFGHVKTSESTVAVLGVKGVEHVRLGSDSAGIAGVFFAGSGDFISVPRLGMDLSFVEKGRSEEPDTADDVVLKGQQANMLGLDVMLADREATASKSVVDLFVCLAGLRAALSGRESGGGTLEQKLCFVVSEAE